MDDEDLRIAVYDRFKVGRIPTVAALSGDLEITAEEVRAGLQSLAGQRHLALGAAGEITMAHPFTAVPLGFSVMGHDTLWWGGCAWDSFALPHTSWSRPATCGTTSSTRAETNGSSAPSSA